jgi:translation initiation factor 1
MYTYIDVIMSTTIISNKINYIEFCFLCIAIPSPKVSRYIHDETYRESSTEMKIDSVTVLLSLVVVSTGFTVVPSTRISRIPPCESSPNEDSPTSQQPKKKAKGFTVNTHVVASISSDGLLAGKPQLQRPKSSKLGVPSKSKPRASDESSRSSNDPLSKQDKQRTGNGTVDSTKQLRLADPENEEIQVLHAKRGAKSVTIVRGMMSPMDDRKVLLKLMKQKLGVGGALVQGVLEIQGDYADKAVEILQSKGYKKARKIGN